MTEDTARRAAIAMVVATIAVVAASIALAQSVDPRWSAGLALVIPTLIARAWFARRADVLAAARKLRESWGGPVDRPRDPAALRRLFGVCGAAARGDGVLDDATWDDLDLDVVYAQIDRTLSTPGEYALYEILRTPLSDAAALDGRERSMEAFAADETTRARVREELDRLGREPIDGLVRVLWTPPPRDLPEDRRLLAQGLLPLVLAAAAILGAGHAVWLLVVAAVVWNVYVHYAKKNEILAQMDAIRHVTALVGAGRRIAALPRAEASAALAATLDAIGDAARAARVVEKKGSLLAWADDAAGPDPVRVVYEYVCVVFLVEVRNYGVVLREIDAHRATLQRLFSLLGELDALQGVASWRTSLPQFCRPEWTPPGDAASLRVEDLVHPLLAAPVPNTFELAGRSALVTGSNMSGKSTFLRALGLSVVFAQTIHTCLARSYRASPLRLASSVTIRDDVASGRSFYLAEAERLLRLVRFAEAAGASLVLVDEPLRGTNSVERVSAVAEILLHLADVGALTVAATHELKIAELVRAKYEPYHFTDEVGEGGLSFPHRIRPGVATTRNAIRLLQQLGYPADLVARADARAAELDSLG